MAGEAARERCTARHPPPRSTCTTSLACSGVMLLPASMLTLLTSSKPQYAWKARRQELLTASVSATQRHIDAGCGRPRVRCSSAHGSCSLLPARQLVMLLAPKHCSLVACSWMKSGGEPSAAARARRGAWTNACARPARSRRWRRVLRASFLLLYARCARLREQSCSSVCKAPCRAQRPPEAPLADCS